MLGGADLAGLMLGICMIDSCGVGGVLSGVI